MDLRDYARVIRRRWQVIVASITGASACAAAFLAFSTPQYESSARLFVSTTQSDTTQAYQGGLFSAQRVKSYADLVASRELAESVIRDLSLGVPASQLMNAVRAEVVPETVILEVTVTHTDPGEAQRRAQSYAENLKLMVQELETPPNESVAPIKATIVDPASPPQAPVAPLPAPILGIGALFGLAVGLGLAFLRDHFDTTIKTLQDCESVISSPLLGTIALDSTGGSRSLITQLHSHSPRVEAFRVLRTNLQFVDVDRKNSIFVVTSSVPGEGKTSTAVNLALAMAEAGRRTLLIEGDLRKPRAARMLSLDEAIGVTTLLVGKVSLDDAVQVHPSTNLHVLGSGAIPPNPAELLQTDAMAKMLLDIRERFDMVIIDAPPLLPVTDAALIASQADGALMIVNYGKTTRDQLKHAVARLSQVEAAPIGFVMNRVPGRFSEHEYGYGYGYAPDVITAPAIAKPARRNRRKAVRRRR